MEQSTGEGLHVTAVKQDVAMVQSTLAQVPGRPLPCAAAVQEGELPGRIIINLPKLNRNDQREA